MQFIISWHVPSMQFLTRGTSSRYLVSCWKTGYGSRKCWSVLVNTIHQYRKTQHPIRQGKRFPLTWQRQFVLPELQIGRIQFSRRCSQQCSIWLFTLLEVTKQHAISTPQQCGMRLGTKFCRTSPMILVRNLDLGKVVSRTSFANTMLATLLTRCKFSALQTDG